MKRTVLLSLVSILVASAPALAGVRPPEPRDTPCNLADRMGFELSVPVTGCQYRFNATGALDELLILVTLRDCFDVPVELCSLDVTLAPFPDTQPFCSCEGTVFGATTDLEGVAAFRFSKIGGRGSLGLSLTARCVGDIALLTEVIDFTTPDQNGSCESAPQASTGVIDLGMWASGTNPPQQTSDFNCDGTVDVLDLATFAAGLGVGCGD